MKNGDIWLVDLSDTKGHEQKGVRPAIVVGGANGLTVVVPCTTTLSTARFSHTYGLSPSSHNGLDAESVALVFQIVALDRDRFRHQIRHNQRTATAGNRCPDAGPAETGLIRFFSFYRHHSYRPNPGKRLLEPLRSRTNIEQRR